MCAQTAVARGKSDGLASGAGLRCVPAESTGLQREGRPGPGGESGAAGAAVAPRADADVPAVRAGVGETRPVCAALHRGQCGVLVSDLPLNSLVCAFKIVQTPYSQFVCFFFPSLPTSSRAWTHGTACASAADSCCFYVMQLFHLSIRARAWWGYL